MTVVLETPVEKMHLAVSMIMGADNQEELYSGIFVGMHALFNANHISRLEFESSLHHLLSGAAETAVQLLVPKEWEWLVRGPAENDANDNPISCFGSISYTLDKDKRVRTHCYAPSGPGALMGAILRAHAGDVEIETNIPRLYRVMEAKP